MYYTNKKLLKNYKILKKNMKNLQILLKLKIY